jgi:putative transposase
VKKDYPKAGIKRLCGLLGKTRHAYYDTGWRQEEQIVEHAIILELVDEVRRDLPRLGTEKLYHMLGDKFNQHGIRIGRDGLHELLVERGMIIRKRRRKPKTTDSKHWMKKYPNLTKELALSAPNQLWVSDITYISILGGFCYLSLITDAYSRKILGYFLHKDLTNTGCIEALIMAIAGRSKQSGKLIHHSDRGSQYCSKDYVHILALNGVFISMTENGDPYENAKAERVNGILKDEFSLSGIFTNYESARQATDSAVRNYNERRPHASIDYLTPAEAHHRVGYLRARWKRKTWQPERFQPDGK